MFDYPIDKVDSFDETNICSGDDVVDQDWVMRSVNNTFVLSLIPLILSQMSD